MHYTPIACDQYDYFEIACMRAYRLLLVLEGEKYISGAATTLSTGPNKAEWLHIQTADGMEKIRLDNIIRFKPTDETAEFDWINLKPD